jgi:hypothetical protein
MQGAPLQLVRGIGHRRYAVAQRGTDKGGNKRGSKVKQLQQEKVSNMLMKGAVKAAAHQHQQQVVSDGADGLAAACLKTAS